MSPHFDEVHTVRMKLSPMQSDFSEACERLKTKILRYLDDDGILPRTSVYDYDVGPTTGSVYVGSTHDRYTGSTTLETSYSSRYKIDPKDTFDSKADVHSSVNPTSARMNDSFPRKFENDQELPSSSQLTPHNQGMSGQPTPQNASRGPTPQNAAQREMNTLEEMDTLKAAARRNLAGGPAIDYPRTSDYLSEIPSPGRSRRSSWMQFGFQETAEEPDEKTVEIDVYPPNSEPRFRGSNVLTNEPRNGARITPNFESRTSYEVRITRESRMSPDSNIGDARVTPDPIKKYSTPHEDPAKKYGFPDFEESVATQEIDRNHPMEREIDEVLAGFQQTLPGKPTPFQGTLSGEFTRTLSAEPISANLDKLSDGMGQSNGMGHGLQQNVTGLQSTPDTLYYKIYSDSECSGNPMSHQTSGVTPTTLPRIEESAVSVPEQSPQGSDEVLSVQALLREIEMVQESLAS